MGARVCPACGYKSDGASETFCPRDGAYLVTPADLAAADWIVREPGSGTRETVDAGLMKPLGWPRPVMVKDDCDEPPGGVSPIDVGPDGWLGEAWALTGSG